MGVSEKSLSWVTDRVTERERGRAGERAYSVCSYSEVVPEADGV